MNPRDDRVDDTSVEAAAPGQKPPCATTLAAEKAAYGWTEAETPTGKGGAKPDAVPHHLVTAGTRGAITETGR